MKRLALPLMALPGPAWAEVCDKMRPNWDGTVTTAMGEALALFLSPGGLFLLAATVVALALRSQWGGLVVVLLWTGFITLVTMADPSGMRAPGLVEGCVGPPTLFIALAAAICVGTVLYTMPRKADDG